MVPDWSLSTAGPSMASKRAVRRRARSSSSREPASGRAPSQVSPRSSRALVGGRTRVAIRRPRYSSSVPAMASGTTGTPIRSAISAAPLRNDPIRPGGPLTVPSGIWTKTPPLASTARAEATCWSTPTPPRQTGSSPPSRWIRTSRHRAVNVDGPLPRNHARGSTGSAWMTTNGSIQPRWAAPISRYPPCGSSSWPDVVTRKRKRTNRMKRARRRMAR
jgi:hypothetical protein